MLCTKFQVFRSKTVTGSFRTYIHTYGQTYIHTYGQTYIHTYRGPKQGKPGRNRNSSQGSVLVSGHYWFVKQCWLVNITGLYRVQVSKNYRFLPQRFNSPQIWLKTIGRLSSNRFRRVTCLLMPKFLSGVLKTLKNYQKRGSEMLRTYIRRPVKTKLMVTETSNMA